MTLITHFRTEKYAVVASDSMEIENKHITQFSRKIFIDNSNTIYGIYGNSLGKQFDGFLQTSNNLSIEEIKEEVKKYIPENKLSLMGLLRVAKDESKLFHITLCERTKQLIHEEYDLFGNSGWETPSSSLDLQCNRQIIIKNPIFFNERIKVEKEEQIDIDYYKHICKIFFQSCDATKASRLNTIEDIEEFIFKSYDRINNSFDLLGRTISGDTFLVILDTHTGDLYRNCNHLDLKAFNEDFGVYFDKMKRCQKSLNEKDSTGTLWDNVTDVNQNDEFEVCSKE